MGKKRTIPEFIEPVSLREFLELRISHLEEKDEWTDDKIRMMKENSDTALKLQASEYERRLEQLNGEYKRIDKVVAERIPREVYEAGMKEANAKIELSNLASANFVTRNELTGILQPQSADIKTMISYKDVQTGKNMVYGVIFAIIVALISAGISLFK